MKFSTFHVSGPGLVCPSTCRWPDLFDTGGCACELQYRHRELDKDLEDPNTNPSYSASWAHASQSHLSKPYRGSFLFFCHFQCLNTHLLKPQDWVKQSIPFSYMAFTATSMDGASHAVQVYSDVSGGTCRHSPRPAFSPQLCHRVELGESIADHSVGPDAQFRCRLPQCYTPDTVNIYGGARPSGMGYTILCHAGRELIAIYLLSYSRSLLQGTNISYQIASDTTSRGNFTHSGVLSDSPDPEIRAVSDHFAVFAISRDLGSIKATQAP